MTKSLNQPVLLGLGARDGNRLEALKRAAARLPRPGVAVVAGSSVWETEPVDLPGSRPVFNAALLVETELAPASLLAACLSIEEAMGRVRTSSRGGGPDPGPRPIDIDLLLFGDLRINEPGLALPHPRLHQRRFVLAPLDEIARDIVHPVLGETIGTLLARCTDTAGARIICGAEEWLSSPGAMR